MSGFIYAWEMFDQIMSDYGYLCYTQVCVYEINCNVCASVYVWEKCECLRMITVMTFVTLACFFQSNTFNIREQ